MATRRRDIATLPYYRQLKSRAYTRFAPKCYSLILAFVLSFIFQFNYALSEHYYTSHHNNGRHNHRHRHHGLSPTPGYVFDTYHDEMKELFESNTWPRTGSLSNKQTPAMLKSPQVDQEIYSDESTTFFRNMSPKKRRYIEPHETLDGLDPLDSEDNLHSPIFEQISTPITKRENRQKERDAQFGKMSNAQSDTNNNLVELIESGSGWDPTADDPNVGSDYTLNPSRVLTNPMSTPRFGSDSKDESDINNQPPFVARRLPVLTATAGQIFRYTIPADTFEDEDGSMRQLRSSLELRLHEQGNSSDSERPFDQYMHWLQYDEHAQTLYGYPTFMDEGKYEYELVVADRWGQTSNTSVEIVVRQHPSIRAFSHSFSLIDIEWNSQRFDSLTKALIDIVKRISENLYSDSSSRNIVIHSYKFPKKNSSSTLLVNALSPMTITWSNASIAVYPCNSTQLDAILETLIGEENNSPNQTSTQGRVSSFTPSQALRRVLEPNFKLSRLDFTLQVSCKNALLGNHLNYTDQEPILKTRTQQLQWRLGQPFVFHIPQDTFLVDGVDQEKAANLTLSLHTIDGIPLEDDPHYSFMEFDQETKTLYGLAYDMNLHSGQRELLLTVRHPNPTYKIARDIMIVDILTPELTTINNRAFNMSLYFTSRLNSFGPRQRFSLSHKIAQSLGVGEEDFEPEPGSNEFIVIEIKKFQIDNQLSSFVDSSNSWAYRDKIRRVEDTFVDKDQVDISTPSETSSLYKLTWTNESIGHKGDCPLEVIVENVVNALEKKMFDYGPPEEEKIDDPTKNDSVRFYERLRSFFEPEIDLMFLSIGPMHESACEHTLGYYDVGNSELADLVLSADSEADQAMNNQEPSDLLGTTHSLKGHEEPKASRPMINSDEYWSIVVLIILVVALIFVVMMFFMAMHTYRINQEKRFELQVKLAQARQNSMYLSSMMLADRAMPQQDFIGQYGAQQSLLSGEGSTSNEEGSSRKPIILDNEKQLWSNGHTDLTATPMYKPTAVQLHGQTVQTTPLRPNMTFTLDSIASKQQNPIQTNHHDIGSDYMIQNQVFVDDRKRSMTLNRRSTLENQQSRLLARQASATQLNHSQSILTVASLAGPVQFVPHQGLANVPIVYAPLPVVCESNEFTAHG